MLFSSIACTVDQTNNSAFFPQNLIGDNDNSVRHNMGLNGRNKTCNSSFFFHRFSKNLTSIVKCVHDILLEFDGVLRLNKIIQSLKRQQRNAFLSQTLYFFNESENNSCFTYFCVWSSNLDVNSFEHVPQTFQEALFWGRSQTLEISYGAESYAL